MKKIEDVIIEEMEKFNDFLVPIRSNKFEIDPLSQHEYLNNLNGLSDIKSSLNNVLKNKVKFLVDEFNVSNEKNKIFPIGDVHNTFHYSLGKENQHSDNIVYIAKNIGIKEPEMSEYFSKIIWKDDAVVINYFIEDAYKNGNKKEVFDLLKNILNKTASREKKQRVESVSKHLMSSNSNFMKALKEEDRNDFFNFFYDKNKQAMSNNLKDEVELDRMMVEPINNSKYSLEEDKMAINGLKLSLESAITEIKKMPNSNKNYILYLNNMLNDVDKCFENKNYDNVLINSNNDNSLKITEEEQQVQEIVQTQREINQELDKPDDDFKKLNKLLKIGAAIFIAKTPIFKKLVTDKVIDKITEDKRENKSVLEKFKIWMNDKFKLLNYDDTTNIKNVFSDPDFTLSEKTNFMLINVNDIYKKSPEKGLKLIEKLNNELFLENKLDHKDMAFALNRLSNYTTEGLKNVNELEVGLYMRDPNIIAKEIVLELEKKQNYSMERNYNFVSEKLDLVEELDSKLAKEVLDKVQDKIFTLGKDNSRERLLSGLLSNELLKHKKGRRLKSKWRPIEDAKGGLKNIGSRLKNLTENSAALERDSLSVKVARKLSEKLRPKMEEIEEDEIKKKKKKNLNII